MLKNNKAFLIFKNQADIYRCILIIYFGIMLLENDNLKKMFKNTSTNKTMKKV